MSAKYVIPRSSTLRFKNGETTDVANPQRGDIKYDFSGDVLQSYNGSSWANVGVAGSGTLDQAYDSGGAGGGRAITVDAGDVELNLAAAGSSLVLDATAAVTDGLLFQRTDANTFTDAIDASSAGITNALNVGANAIVGTTGAITYTNFTVGAGGAITGISLAQSAAGGTLLLDGNGAGGVTVNGTATGAITLARAVTCSTTLTVTGAATFNGGISAIAGDVNITPTDTTGDGVLIDGSTITTGNVLRLEYDAANSGAGFAALSVTEDGAEVWALAEDGNTTISGTALGTAALTLTAGDLVLSSGNVDLTTTGAGAADIVDITRANAATGGHAIDIAMGTGTVAGAGLRVAFGGAATGDGVAVDMTNAVGANAIDLIGAGARTVPLVNIADASGIAGAECVSIAKSAGAASMVLLDNNGAAGSDSLQIDNQGNVTGRFIDLVGGAWTGTASEGAIHFLTTAAATVAAGRVIDIEQLGTGTHGAQILGSGLRINEDATGPAAHTDANNSYAISVDTAGGTVGGIHVTTAATELAILCDGEFQITDNNLLEFGTTTADSSISSDGTTTNWSLTAALRVGAAGGVANYSNFAASTGALTFVGTARPTKSEFIPASSFLTHAGSPSAGTQVGAGIVRGWAMDAAADEAVVAQWIIPDNVVAGSTGSAYIYWASGTGASDVVWDCTTLVAAESDALAGAGTTNSVTDTGDAVANDLNITAAMTTAALTAGRMLAIQINRDANNVADTLAADAVILGVRIDYSAGSV